MARILACLTSALLLGLAVGCSPASDPVTEVDGPAVRALVTERFPAALAGVVEDDGPLRDLLAEDVRLRWPKVAADGRDAFVGTIRNAWAEEARAFVVAVANHRFRLQRCGEVDLTRRPVGLPESVDVSSFEPGAVDPEDFAAHPGLMQVEVRPIADLPGTGDAAGRYLRVARFRHSWMELREEPFVYVERYTVVKRAGELRIAEYEFTASRQVDPPVRVETCR